MTTRTSKVDQIARADYIASLLRKGKKREDIVAECGKKWRKAPRTIDRLIKVAAERIAAEQKAVESARVGTMVSAAKEAAEAAILTEIELDAILSTIASGRIKVEEIIRGKAVLRDVSPTEIIAAADKLYKRKGSYAPDKVAQTDKSGNDVEPIDLSTLTDDELEERMKIR